MRIVVRVAGFVSPPILWFLLICTLSNASAWAEDVGLAWDPNTETDLAGYRVYVGTAPRTYGPPVTIGTQTSYTVTSLTPGTYYFAVTAFNTAGLESGFSNEVFTTVAGSTTSCDISGDGLVNSTDVQALVNVILGVRTPIAACDVNRDSKVDVVDVQILVNVVLGLRSCP